MSVTDRNGAVSVANYTPPQQFIVCPDIPAPMDILKKAFAEAAQVLVFAKTPRPSSQFYWRGKVYKGEWLQLAQGDGKRVYGLGEDGTKTFALPDPIHNILFIQIWWRIGA